MAAVGYQGGRTTLYRAIKQPNGKVVVIDPQNLDLLSSTSKVVDNERDYQLAVSLGWRPSPQEALELFEKEEQEIANAAAERAYDDQRMSEKAKAEVEVAEAATSKHVVEIPEGPKRGRPKKVQ